MNLARVAAMLDTVGADGYERIARTGTWPIECHDQEKEIQPRQRNACRLYV